MLKNVLIEDSAGWYSFNKKTFFFQFHMHLVYNK